MLCPGPARRWASSVRTSEGLALRAPCPQLTLARWALAGLWATGSKRAGPAADQTATLGPPVSAGREWADPPALRLSLNPPCPLPSPKPCVSSLSPGQKQPIQPTVSSLRALLGGEFRKDDTTSPAKSPIVTASERSQHPRSWHREQMCQRGAQ